MVEEGRDLPGEVMRDDWNRRAEENHKLHIATGHAHSDEEFRASGEKDLVEAILDGISLWPEAKALEIGCGVGRLLVPLSDRIAAAHGVDISEVMVAKSRDYCTGRSNLTIRRTDGMLKEFGDESIDFVFSFIVFQHVPFREAIETYVREAARVLVPGGVLRFQVDGRWRDRAGHAADTYDGVVFNPGEVRRLVGEAGLTLLEEWGEETHYHWVTARKPGAGAGRVSFQPATYDTALLETLLGNLGVASAASGARVVASGHCGVRAVLGPFESRYETLANAAFVDVVFRALLGRSPDPSGLAYHTRILDEGFEDRSALVDTILCGAEFRQLVRPRVPLLPWPRFAALAVQGGLPTFFGAVDAVVARIRELTPDEAVGESFRLCVGQPPDEEGRAYNIELIGRSEYGRRLFVRQLLSHQDGVPLPAPLSYDRTREILNRLGALDARPARHLLEAFPGEGAAAAQTLARTASLPVADFVEVVYQLVLGRGADDEGRCRYIRRLESGSLSRAALLRDLLWSEELRSR